MSFTGRLEDIDLRLLRVFVAVAENGGVSNAAETLGVDRSTISRQLSDIESRLELRLCERSRSGFRLTEEGRTILARTQELLGAVRAFNMQVNDIHKELSGDLIIAISDTSALFSGLNLPTTLDEFHTEAPKIDFSVKILPPNEVERAVNNRTCSLGIMPQQASLTSLNFEPLYQENNALYARYDHDVFSLSASLTIGDLKRVQFAVVEYETRMTRLIKELGLKRGPITNSSEGLLALIQTGTCVGILPTFYGDMFVQAGMLKRINIEETSYSVDMGLITHHQDRKSAMISLFRKVLKKNLIK